MTSGLSLSLHCFTLLIVHHFAIAAAGLQCHARTMCTTSRLTFGRYCRVGCGIEVGVHATLAVLRSPVYSFKR